MVDKKDAKIKLSSFEYGRAQADCSFNAVFAGILPFMISIVAIPSTLKYLERVVYTFPEIRLVAGLAGSAGIALYSCKFSKDRCESKLAAKYTYE